MSSVAIITPALSDPRREGAAYRLWRIAQLLLEMEFEVSLHPLQTAFETVPAAVMEERAAFWGSSGVPIREVPDETTAAPTAFWYDGYLAAHLALATFRSRFPQSRHFFDTVDLASRRYFREAKQRNDRSLLRKAVEVKAIERHLAQAADVTLMISEEEATILRQALPSMRLEVLTNIHDVVPQPAPFEERSGVAFIGSFHHAPNRDAVAWLVSAIWPQVMAIHPTLKLDLVGDGPIDELLASDTTGSIHAYGYVESLEPFLARRRLTVAPLRFGGGIKGKVLLSLGQGVPVIGTDVALEGFSEPSEIGAVLAQAPDAIAQALCKLYADASQWHTLSLAGRNYVQSEFSSRRMRSRLESLFPPKSTE